MKFTDNKELTEASNEYGKAEEKYIEAFSYYEKSGVSFPMVLPAYFDSIKAYAKSTELMRKAIERGTALTQDEINKAFDMSEESWAW
ncbi:MAG: hypothetical protein M0P27_01695 [Bacteroidales bacterium]|nr:hypothetical protein [Bacteroidales bacterium]